MGRGFERLAARKEWHLTSCRAVLGLTGRGPVPQSELGSGGFGGEVGAQRQFFELGRGEVEEVLPNLLD